jgi:hypothetical protein
MKFRNIIPIVSNVRKDMTNNAIFCVFLVCSGSASLTNAKILRRARLFFAEAARMSSTKLSVISMTPWKLSVM